MVNRSNIKVLVACHKADSAIRQDDVHMPIQVGKVLHPDLDLGFQGDDTGENISDKNGSYNELTAIYWAYKNLKDVDYIGLCHYRRYFDIDFSNTAKVNKLLHSCDVVIVNECVKDHSIINELRTLTTLEDAAIVIDTILTEHPEWRHDVLDYFYRNNKYSVYNMFIASKKVFDDYCNFMFPLLEKIESQLCPHSYARLQRTMGYIAEAMLGFWIRARKYKVSRVETVICDDQEGNKLDILHRIWRVVYVKQEAYRRCIIWHLRPRAKDIDVYYAVRVGLRQNGIELKSI